MSTAYIKRRMLTWAIERSGLSPEQLSTRSMTAESILAWMNGDRLPTEAQAETLAEKLRIPYLLLFVESPPEIDKITLPDLRTMGGRPIEKPSIDFIDTLNDVMLRQDWFRDHKEADGSDRLAFVGKYTLNNSPKEVADDMRSALGVDREFRAELSEWQDLVKGLTKRAEKLGILVMRSGFVGHATNRPLDVNEFRGFALSDPMAPVVFVNSRDAKAAQNFTLAHELAHIWIGESGISNVKMSTEFALNPNRVEQFCNQVAAELLVPSIEFQNLWNADDTLWVNVRRIGSVFKVSSLVVLLRALDNAAIQYPAFKSAFDREEEAFRELEKPNEKDERKGQFWSAFPWRVSQLFGRTLVEDVRRERTTYSEASSLLNINVSSFESYFHQESGT